jgi:cell division protease FtsH
MVTKWGLSERLGPLMYGEDDGEVFLGHSVTKRKEVSENTAYAIDEEVRVIINRNYDRAKNLLQINIDKLHKMSEALLKYETIDAEQIEAIMHGLVPHPPKGWRDPDGAAPIPPATGGSASAGETSVIST